MKPPKRPWLLWALFAGFGVLDTAYSYGVWPAVMAAAVALPAFFCGLVALPEKDQPQPADPPTKETQR